MVDCCANTSLMRARPDSLLHCMAKTSLMRAFFSAQVLALCPFEKCMGTLYHNRAPTQGKFSAAQRRAVRSEAFPVLHGVEHSRFSASPVHQSQREGPWCRQSPRHAAERASHVRASMKGARVEMCIRDRDFPQKALIVHGSSSRARISHFAFYQSPASRQACGRKTTA